MTDKSGRDNDVGENQTGDELNGASDYRLVLVRSFFLFLFVHTLQKLIELGLLFRRQDGANARPAFLPDLVVLHVGRLVDSPDLSARIVYNRPDLLLLIGRELKLERKFVHNLFARRRTRVRTGLLPAPNALSPQVIAHATDKQPEEKHHEHQQSRLTPRLA
jgi:hypothetical protein